MPPPTRPNLDLSSSHLFDAIIIGGGPAGLSAALALCRMKRTAVVFSNSQFRNEKAHHAHTILSRDHTPPGEIRRIAKEQIDLYGTANFIERKIIQAQKDDDENIFEVEDEQGEKWRGKKVVLATGMQDVLPKDIPGYEANWGHNSTSASFATESSARISQLEHWDSPMGCPRVTIFGNGELQLEDEPAKKALEIAKAKGAKIDERRIERLVDLGSEEQGMEILFEDGSKTKVGFLAHKPDLELVSPEIAQMLGVEIVSDKMGGQGLKRNEPFGETNVKGVLAAGDVGNMFKQVPYAMLQGTLAGGGVQVLISQDEEHEVVKKLGLAE